jgi:hypothetical protein
VCHPTSRLPFISFVTGSYSLTMVGLTSSMMGDGIASTYTTLSSQIGFFASSYFSCGDLIALHFFPVIRLGAPIFGGIIFLNPVKVSLNIH